ncbi:MAG: thiamine ABC transporter substrate-binding protein [Bdellovibrionota bacterium]
MKHFIIFVGLIFSLLLSLYYYRDDQTKNIEDKKVHVYASSSFVAKWGPGPILKEIFEKQNIFKVEFIEISDMAMTIQKINFENESSLADVILGIDQFDMVRVANKIKWRDIERSTTINFVNNVKPVASEKAFVPYDWAPMSFIARRDEKNNINSLKDLLNPELQGKIALQDPRTSSPGLQFLVWVFESYSPEEALRYLKQMARQAHSFSPSWSASYGLFKNNQADFVFSYVTSPIYHLLEEKDDQYLSIETQEALPMQVEFAGIPSTCKNCEAAEMFVNFLLSAEAQKIIMSKNYMLPVIEHVKEATPFDAIKIYKTRPIKFYEQNKIEKWINVWTEIRKNEGT